MVSISLFRGLTKAALCLFETAVSAFTDSPWAMISSLGIFLAVDQRYVCIGLGTVPQHWMLLCIGCWHFPAMKTVQDLSALPTLDSLGATEATVEAASPIEEANKWISAFVDAVRTSDIASAVGLFHQTGSWRDVIAITWNLRKLGGNGDIRRLLEARLEATSFTTL